ncbi:MULTISPECIES: TonB-dependent receptor [unclassified Pannonibacter]|uniref:TonB-dependent receptor n=1 Tax=unclassified Pannonibacter TaxID=2627228 RepID=UPI001646E0FD|nr:MULTISPECIES: TonB-dependent receptor [unclassified Pannonibacter]
MSLDTRFRSRLRPAAILTLTTVLASSALPASPQAEEAVTDLQAITIFANYWEEMASKSATTATILTGRDLDRPATPDLDAVAERSANTVFQRANSQARLVVRGVSAFDNALSDPVGYLVNGVPLPMGTIQLPHFFGAETVTLLKGPQGTAFGRNSEAGLLSFDTIRPGTREGVTVRIGAEGSDAGASPVGGNGSAIWSGRIEDGPGLAFGLEAAHDPGVVSNPLTGRKDGGKSRRATGFGGLEWELSDGGHLRLTTMAEDQKFNKEQFRYVAGPLATERFQSAYSDPSSENRRSTVSALQFQTVFDTFDLTAITGLATFDRDFQLDFDGSPLRLGVTSLDLRDRTVSQEIRLTSAGAEPLKWTLGVSGFRQWTRADFNLGSMSTDRHTEIDQTGAALFGFAEYALSDRFRLGSGLRIDHVSSRAWQRFTSPRSRLRYSGSDHSTAVLPKLTAAYDVTGATTVHASLARGYMPAGYNYGFANSEASFGYNAEHSWTTEAGIKHELGNGGSLALAAFHTTVKDKQIAETIPGAAQFISNAGEARIYGIEVEAVAPLGHGFELVANAGWQRARATSLQTTSVNVATGMLMPVNWSDNALPLAPDVTWGLALSHRGEVWSGRVSLSGSGSYWFDPGNSIKQKGYMTVDAEISRKTGNGELTLWAKNLFDEAYYSAAASTPRGVVAEDGSPRKIGMTWRLTW